MTATPSTDFMKNAACVAKRTGFKVPQVADAFAGDDKTVKALYDKVDNGKIEQRVGGFFAGVGAFLLLGTIGLPPDNFSPISPQTIPLIMMLAGYVGIHRGSGEIAEAREAVSKKINGAAKTLDI